ncbi:hypothetical protein CFIO01_12026 [Colletotrichum fioriniae PJ7]|uniref:Uncharacterized protein n=1 Tax=Colletotrichum fioriniae PJ7 TaxID=1445577 RepID=A0A010RKX2_9PEZI|nr:hypothetical protein CFIO01_12026 [Colletotrichum fioriniae PJ7]
MTAPTVKQDTTYTESAQHAYGHSYHHSIPDNSAIKTASTYVKAVQESRKYITNRLSSHADLLMSRWRKRSREKHRELLHKAVPKLEESQRRQLLVPWLNVEVLKASPAILFALLHSRALYPPEDFAPLDCRQMELSCATGNFDVEFSAKCVVMCGPRCGDFVDWDAQHAHSRYTLGYPRARLVLEAQTFLMNALSRITDEILEGADAGSASARTDKWRDLTFTGFRHQGETELWSPYTNTAFSRPPKLDMGYIASMAQTRKEEAIDHLIDLQCDPAYLRRHIKGLFSTTLFRMADTEDAAMMVAKYIHLEQYASRPADPSQVRPGTGCSGTSPRQPSPGADSSLQIFHALVQNNRKEAARIDEFLMREMADISALHETLISLRLNRPQNTSKVVKDFKKMGKALVDGFYKGKAPSSEKNKAWLQQSQTLRGFVEGFFKELGNLVRKDLAGFGLEVETIEETLSVAEKPAPGTFRDRSTETEGSIRADLVQTSHREKVKTRPDNSSSSAQPVDDLESLDIATLSIEPVTRLRVSLRTLDVVYLMYPDAQTKSRNITWDDFVHALCDAGFVASNNGGLAVRFELGSGGFSGEKGAIIFYKSHPVLKIDPVMLHGMGRRLTKWFGWTRDSFSA